MLCIYIIYIHLYRVYIYFQLFVRTQMPISDYGYFIVYSLTIGHINGNVLKNLCDFFFLPYFKLTHSKNILTFCIKCVTTEKSFFLESTQNKYISGSSLFILN